MPGYIGRTEIQIAGGAISRNVFVGNGATTSFGPLDQTPFNEEETIVTINGVVQHDASYAVVVDYVNFGVAPDNLDEIEVKVHSTERQPIVPLGDNGRFDRALIPSRRVVEDAGSSFGPYNVTTRATYENTTIFATNSLYYIDLDTAVQGDTIEIIHMGQLTINPNDNLAKTTIIDGAGGVTVLVPAGAPDYVIPTGTPASNRTLITYTEDDEVLVQTSQVQRTVNGLKGWVPMGGGMIMNWGSVPFPDINNSLSQTFEKAFPTAVVSVVCTGVGTLQGGGTDDYWLVSAIGLAGFTIYNGYDGDKGAQWIAIGY